MSPTQSSTEANLAFVLSAVAPAGCRVPRQADIGSIDDWENVWKQATIHEVRPLVSRAITGLRDRPLPPGLRTRIESFDSRSRKRNLILAHETERVCEALADAGVKCISFKGVTLGASVYGSVLLRETRDLDILIPEASLVRAEAVLRALNYEYDGDESVRYAFAAGGAQFPYQNRHTGTRVDLHWKIYPPGFPYPVDSSAIWTNCRPVHLVSRTVMTLGDSELVPFLAGHGSKEDWRTLKWVSDFARCIVNRPNLDWDKIGAEATRRAGKRQLSKAVSLAHDLLGVEPPDGLREFVRESLPLGQAWRRQNAGFARRGDSTGLEDLLTTKLAYFDGLRGKVSVFMSYLLHRTRGDYAFVALPRSMWWAYFLLRPIRLAGRVAPFVYRQLVGKRRLTAAAPDSDP